MVGEKRTSTKMVHTSGTVLGPRISHSRPRPPMMLPEEEGQGGQIGVVAPAQGERLESLDDLRHLAGGVDAPIEPGDVGRATEDARPVEAVAMTSCVSTAFSARLRVSVSLIGRSP